jgi:hypothetical protein
MCVTVRDEWFSCCEPHGDVRAELVCVWVKCVRAPACAAPLRKGCILCAPVLPNPCGRGMCFPCVLLLSCSLYVLLLTSQTDGATPLYTACQAGSLPIAEELLLVRGADINLSLVRKPACVREWNTAHSCPSHPRRTTTHAPTHPRTHAPTACACERRCQSGLGAYTRVYPSMESRAQGPPHHPRTHCLRG